MTSIDTKWFHFILKISRQWKWIFNVFHEDDDGCLDHFQIVTMTSTSSNNNFNRNQLIFLSDKRTLQCLEICTNDIISIIDLIIFINFVLFLLPSEKLMNLKYVMKKKIKIKNSSLCKIQNSFFFKTSKV
jgi:hypothetical protein